MQQVSCRAASCCHQPGSEARMPATCKHTLNHKSRQVQPWRPNSSCWAECWALWCRCGCTPPLSRSQRCWPLPQRSPQLHQSSPPGGRHTAAPAAACEPAQAPMLLLLPVTALCQQPPPGRGAAGPQRPSAACCMGRAPGTTERSRAQVIRQGICLRPGHPVKLPDCLEEGTPAGLGRLAVSRHLHLHVILVRVNCCRQSAANDLHQQQGYLHHVDGVVGGVPRALQILNSKILPAAVHLSLQGVQHTARPSAHDTQAHKEIQQGVTSLLSFVAWGAADKSRPTIDASVPCCHKCCIPAQLCRAPVADPRLTCTRQWGGSRCSPGCSSLQNQSPLAAGHHQASPGCRRCRA